MAVELSEWVQKRTEDWKRIRLWTVTWSAIKKTNVGTRYDQLNLKLFIVRFKPENDNENERGHIRFMVIEKSKWEKTKKGLKFKQDNQN